MGSGWCNHPMLGTSPVHGDPKSLRCTGMRNTTVYCGPEGRLFDPKPTLKERLWHILKLN